VSSGLPHTPTTDEQSGAVSPTSPDVAAEGDSPVQAPHTTVTVIATRDEYLAAVDAIAAGHGPIAIDAERASGYRYSQRAYLIQIYRRGAGTFLFDPPAIGDFSELNAVIDTEEWILHAASQDLSCLREIGLNPTRIYDTELAARIAGLPRVGLGTVVEELLGIHLAKEHSAADWSTRPLPQAWLVYAALDVELLVDLREKMGELLERDGKTLIADQEFASIAVRDFTIVRHEPWRRLSGLPSIRGQRGLAVARELWHARDDYAREIDTAPGRLVPDTALTAAAKALPATKRDLASIKEFTGRASRSQLDRWWAAIERGVATTDLPATRAAGETIPAPRMWSDRNPEADKRLKGARAALTELSEFFHIPLENLLTPDSLRRLAWAPPEPLTLESIGVALTEYGSRPWQIEATAQRIMDAFVEASQTNDEGDEPAS
jgi:ribonuclease D